jgi:hypothetical protein
MKLVTAILAALIGAVLIINIAQAQPRVYHQGELDAMLAPIALQPDNVVSQVLIAATRPHEVAAAARWVRANPHLRGDDALRAIQYEPWDPVVKSLVAFPDLLVRMDESPQWLHDLGEAYRWQQPHVMQTLQSLRQRAQAAGYLGSNEEQAVYQDAGAIVVQPRTEYVYVRYYDPYVVYGPWWWPHYRPVYWRPWVPRPVFVAHTFHHHKPHHWNHHHHQPHHVVVKPHVRVPEAQRKPIIQQHHVIQQRPPVVQHGQPRHMPAASGFSSKQQLLQRNGQRNGKGRPTASGRNHRG